MGCTTELFHYPVFGVWKGAMGFFVLGHLNIVLFNGLKFVASFVKDYYVPLHMVRLQKARSLFGSLKFSNIVAVSDLTGCFVMV